MMGNRGTFNKPWRLVISDYEFVYHVLHMVLCILGLCVHEFFYSLLVSLSFIDLILLLGTAVV